MYVSSNCSGAFCLGGFGLEERVGWGFKSLFALVGIGFRLTTIGRDDCRGDGLSNTLRSCCVRFCPGTDDWLLRGETFSGFRIGHCSSVGLPASASTSVRRAFSGLAGFTICANGGLGRGLSRFGTGMYFFGFCRVSCNVKEAVTH
jgi:hypothetical protein